MFGLPSQLASAGGYVGSAEIVWCVGVQVQSCGELVCAGDDRPRCAARALHRRAIALIMDPTATWRMICQQHSMRQGCGTALAGRRCVWLMMGCETSARRAQAAFALAGVQIS